MHGDNYDAVGQYSSCVTVALLGAVTAWVVFRLDVLARKRLASD